MKITDSSGVEATDMKQLMWYPCEGTARNLNRIRPGKIVNFAPQTSPPNLV